MVKIDAPRLTRVVPAEISNEWQGNIPSISATFATFLEYLWLVGLAASAYSMRHVSKFRLIGYLSLDVPGTESHSQ